MTLRTSTRRPLWLLALPILALAPLSPVLAQDDAPPPVANPADNGTPDTGTPEDIQPEPPIEPNAPVEEVPIAEMEQRAIDTLDFAAYLQVLGGAAQIELDQNMVSVPQLAAALAKATGLRVEVSPQWEAYPDSRISAKIAKSSLWDALGQLKARGVDAQWISTTRTLQLLPLSDDSEAKVPPRNPLSQDLGGAQLGLVRIQRTRALRFPAQLAPAAQDGDKSDRFEVELALRPDPRWRSIDGTASWAGLSLIDAKGKAHPVLVDSAGGTVEGAQAAFDAAGVDASGPLTLRGELRFAVVAKSQKWALGDLTKPAKLAIERDGVAVQYEYLGLSDDNGVRSMKFAASNAADAPSIVVALPSPDPNVPSSNLPLYHFAGISAGGGLRLMKADGAAVDFMESGSGLQSSERSEFEIQTLPDPTSGEAQSPARAEVEVPLEWREVRIPFEIKDIPLP